MTEPDLVLIEQTLGIRLPPAYRQVMLASGLREDLEGEGVDPDGDPVSARQIQEANEREGLWFNGGCLVAAMLLVLGAVAVWRWLT